MYSSFGGHLDWIHYFAIKIRLPWTSLYTIFGHTGKFLSKHLMWYYCFIISIYVFTYSDTAKLYSKIFNKILFQQKLIS